MDEKLLTALGLRSLDEETLTFLRYGLAEIDGNEGTKIVGITPHSFRVRASRIRYRKGTLSSYKKKRVWAYPATIGRFLKEEGCETLQYL
jgi:hypothetical protein